MEKVKPSLLAELKNSYLFKDFSNEELEAVLHMARRESVTTGHSVLAGDRDGESFCFIHFGSLRTQLAGPQGEVTALNLIGTGAILGAASIVTTLPRLMDAEAVEQTELFIFDKKALESYFADHPETAVKFYRSMSAHLAHTLQMTMQELAEVRETSYLEKHGLSSL
jgi:CRP-like cAMP-binding protein